MPLLQMWKSKSQLIILFIPHSISSLLSAYYLQMLCYILGVIIDH